MLCSIMTRSHVDPRMTLDAGDVPLRPGRASPFLIGFNERGTKHANTSPIPENTYQEQIYTATVFTLAARSHHTQSNLTMSLEPLSTS
jgi:hypothetical protein